MVSVIERFHCICMYTADVPTNKMLVPNGVRYRGVPLYMHVHWTCTYQHTYVKQSGVHGRLSVSQSIVQQFGLA